MTTLVTGGAGFIGGHLIERLLTHNHDVRVVDDLSSSPMPWEALRDELAAAHPGYPAMMYRCQFWQENISFYAMRGQNSERLDGIYHLASPVGPAGILDQAGRIADKIVAHTMAVISLALMHKCRLVYVSTSEIYGGGVNGLCREDTPCIVPISNPSARLEYAIGKLAGEIAVLNTPGLDAVIVRPFNVAGPRQSGKGGFVLPRFVEQALSAQPLTVFGDGSQVRAFTHVKDIAEGLVRAMERGKSGQAYNLGNPANRTVISMLASSVMQAAGADPSNVVYLDGKEVYGPAYAEASDKYPDADKAMKELDWNPQYSLREIVQGVIDYERSKVHAS